MFSRIFNPAAFVMVIAAALAGISQSAMAQSNSSNQTQSQKAQSAQPAQSQSSGSDNTLNNILGAINSLVKSGNSSSTDASAKPGKTATGQPGKTTTAQAGKTAQPDGEDVGKSLADLKDLYERGLITKGEYDAKRKELIAKIH